MTKKSALIRYNELTS